MEAELALKEAPSTAAPTPQGGGASSGKSCASCAPRSPSSTTRRSRRRAPRRASQAAAYAAAAAVAVERGAGGAAAPHAVAPKYAQVKMPTLDRSRKPDATRLPTPERVVSEAALGCAGSNTVVRV